jgi:hypothetical protein
MMTTQRLPLFFLCAGIFAGCECGTSEGGGDAGPDAHAPFDASDSCAGLTPEDDGEACTFEIDCVRDHDGPARCGTETWSCVGGTIEYSDDTGPCDTDAGVDASADAGSDAGTDGGVTPACGTDLPLFDGELCGGSEGGPCDLVDDVEIDGPAFRNFAPSIAVDDADVPAIVWSTAVGGFTGHFARREGAGFVEETLPVALARGALGYAGADPIVLAYTGAVTMSAVYREAGAFVSRDPLAGVTGERWIDFDDGGCVHLVRNDGVGEPLVYSLLSGDGWESRPLGAHISAMEGALALSAGGTPHVVYWEAPDGAWRLRWRRGTDAIEDVGDSSAAEVDLAYATAFAVLGEIPHVSFKRGAELAYRVRDGIGWSAIEIERDAIEGCDPRTPPTIAGMTCAYARTTHEPIEIVTSASGKVRVIYAANVETASLVSFCSGPPGPPGCEWSGTPVFSGSLRMAAIEGESVRHVTLLDDVIAIAGRAVVDRRGFIHVALYTNDAAGEGLYVRYAVFGTVL